MIDLPPQEDELRKLVEDLLTTAEWKWQQIPMAIRDRINNLREYLGKERRGNK